MAPSVVARRGLGRPLKLLQLRSTPRTIAGCNFTTCTIHSPKSPSTVQDPVSRAYSSTRVPTTTMATPYHIQVSPTDSGILGFKQDEATASKISELLQKDIESHHVFFNASGFHNHQKIPHHLFTLYGTGAGPDAIQAAYDKNKSYQIKAQDLRPGILEELQTDYASAAPRYLGKGKHYGEFLRFFQGEMEAKGWQAVLGQYLFDDEDALSRDLLARLFAGVLHPLIQLMFGVEWAQPAVVAEALAQAAVHEDNLADFLESTERRASEQPAETRPIVELIEELSRAKRLGGGDAALSKLAGSAPWKHDDPLYKGFFGSARDEAVDHVSRIRVKAEELDERTAEMIHSAAYVAAATAWHPPHIPKFDFFIIHHLTSAPIFLTINKQSWIPTTTKIRLLEWKMRLDITNYIARGCPALHPAAVRSYHPRDGSSAAAAKKPVDLLPKFHDIVDDGHLIKVVRGMLVAQEASNKYLDRPWIQYKTDEDWLAAHQLLLDSVQGQPGSLWIFDGGYEEAWADIPRDEVKSK